MQQMMVNFETRIVSLYNDTFGVIPCTVIRIFEDPKVRLPLGAQNMPTYP